MFFRFVIVFKHQYIPNQQRELLTQSKLRYLSATFKLVQLQVNKKTQYLSLQAATCKIALC